MPERVAIRPVRFGGRRGELQHRGWYDGRVTIRLKGKTPR